MTWTLTLTLTLTMTVTVHGPDPRPVPDRVPVRDGPQLARGDVQLANGGCIALPGSAEIPQMREMPQIRHTTQYVDRYVCVVPSRVGVEKRKKRAEKRIRGRSEEAKKARMLQGSNCKEQAGSANEAAQSIPAA